MFWRRLTKLFCSTVFLIRREVHLSWHAHFPPGTGTFCIQTKQAGTFGGDDSVSNMILIFLSSSLTNKQTTLSDIGRTECIALVGMSRDTLGWKNLERIPAKGGGFSAWEFSPSPPYFCLLYLPSCPLRPPACLGIPFPTHTQRHSSFHHGQAVGSWALHLTIKTSNFCREA